MSVVKITSAYIAPIVRKIPETEVVFHAIENILTKDSSSLCGLKTLQNKTIWYNSFSDTITCKECLEKLVDFSSVEYDKSKIDSLS